jgi:hypothetical protein
LVTKRWFIVGAVLLACAVLAVVVVRPLLRAPSLRTSRLHGGQSVVLRSGLTIVIPMGASGTVSRWRNPSDAAKTGDMAESIFLHTPARAGTDAVALSSYANGTGPGVAFRMPGRLAAGSSSAVVEIRWTRPEAGEFNVWIVTRLPGHLRGLIAFSALGATSRQRALEAANNVWRYLSIGQPMLRA